MNKQNIIERLRGHVIDFGKIISPKTFDESTPYFHYEWEDILLGRATVDKEVTPNGEIIETLRYGEFKNRKIMLKCPRDTAKSTIIGKIYPLYHCCYDPGDKYILIQSKTFAEAKKRLRSIKNILDFSEEFQTLFGYWGESVATEWTKEKIIVRRYNPVEGKTQEWTFEAKGYGQQTQGLKEDDQRLTLYIGDDLEDEDNTKTDISIEQNFKKFMRTMPAVTKDGQAIVIGTPIVENCLVEQLMTMENWVSKTYQSVDEEKKTSIWEEHLPYEEMMAEKRALASKNREYLWYSERQCEIRSGEGGLFPEKVLRYWDGYYDDGCLFITHLGSTNPPPKLEEREIVPVNIYIGGDPASSESTDADYSTTVPVAFDRAERVFVLPYFEKQCKPSVHAEDIVSKAVKYKPKKTRLEANAYQAALIDMVKKLADRKNLYINGLRTKFIAKGKKDERLEALDDFTSETRLYLMPDMLRMKTEFTKFPRGRKNLLDGLYWATRRFEKPIHTYGSAKKKKKTKLPSWEAA